MASLTPARGLAQAVEDGVLPKLPRLHAVQTQACYPLVRAYEKLARAMDRELTDIQLVFAETDRASLALAARDRRAQRIAAAWEQPEVQRVWLAALRDRSSVMWPWEHAPHSIARGILDDETYDWVAALQGTFQSAGFPVVVGEEEVQRANVVARVAAGVAADETGSAGLAGGDCGAAAVLFTGGLR